MASILPVVFVWRELDVCIEGGEVVHVRAMVPLPRYGNVCASQYHDGEEYPLVPLEARSRASHNHYFASVAEGFKNLPEKIAHRWRDDDHLRLWILVETKWCDEYEFKFADAKEARYFATKYRQQFQRYVRIEIDGAVVLVKHPKSQSAAAMGKAEFEQSKRDVLDALEHMIKVEKGTLMKEAGRSA